MAEPIKVFADLVVSVSDGDINVKADGDKMAISLPSLNSVARTRGPMLDLLQQAIGILRKLGVEVEISAGDTRIATLRAKEQRRTQ